MRPDMPHPARCCCAHHSPGLRLLPPQMGALALVLLTPWPQRPSSQCLLSPAQAPHSSYHLCLPGSYRLSGEPILPHSQQLFFFSFFSNLSTQCGGPAHEPEIKSRMPYRLSWPGTPSQQLSRASMRTRKSVLLGRQASVPDHTRFGRRSWGWPSVPSFPLGAQPLGTLVPTF